MVAPEVSEEFGVVEFGGLGVALVVAAGGADLRENNDHPREAGGCAAAVACCGLAAPELLESVSSSWMATLPPRVLEFPKTNEGGGALLRRCGCCCGLCTKKALNRFSMVAKKSNKNTIRGWYSLN